MQTDIILLYSAGTMQLMAGVRLCTWRPITNHPHFEDKELRIRTRELYKMYGQFSPEEVYDTMVKYNVSFMILEDSQCMSAGGRPDRCGLPDTVDLTYGHVSCFCGYCLDMVLKSILYFR